MTIYFDSQIFLHFWLRTFQSGLNSFGVFIWRAALYKPFTFACFFQPQEIWSFAELDPRTKVRDKSFIQNLHLSLSDSGSLALAANPQKTFERFPSIKVLGFRTMLIMLSRIPHIRISCPVIERCSCRLHINALEIRSADMGYISFPRLASNRSLVGVCATSLEAKSFPANSVHSHIYQHLCIVPVAATCSSPERLFAEGS